MKFSITLKQKGFEDFPEKPEPLLDMYKNPISGTIYNKYICYIPRFEEKCYKKYRYHRSITGIFYWKFIGRITIDDYEQEIQNT